MKGSDPTNCPFQVGSQTAEHESARSAVTKSREGKSALGLPGSSGGLGVSQSGEAKTQAVGKRTTVGIVKVSRQKLLIEPVIFGRRSPVRWEKSAIIKVASGRKHLMTRRCKRRRHESRVSWSNWGGPARFRQRSGVKTIRWVDPFNQPSALAEASLPRTGTSGCLGISLGIRRNAESRGKVLQGVGDAHSSVDGKDNITLSERRGISLRTQPLKGET
jgi:hypothetical protein